MTFILCVPSLLDPLLNIPSLLKSLLTIDVMIPVVGLGVVVKAIIICARDRRARDASLNLEAPDEDARPEIAR